MRYGHSTTYAMYLTMASSVIISQQRSSMAHACWLLSKWNWLDDGLVNDTGSSYPSQGG